MDEIFFVSHNLLVLLLFRALLLDIDMQSLCNLTNRVLASQPLTGLLYLNLRHIQPATVLIYSPKKLER